MCLTGWLYVQDWVTAGNSLSELQDRTGGDSECGRTLGMKLSSSVEEMIVFHIHKEGEVT